MITKMITDTKTKTTMMITMVISSNLPNLVAHSCFWADSVGWRHAEILKKRILFWSLCNPLLKDTIITYHLTGVYIVMEFRDRLFHLVHSPITLQWRIPTRKMLPLYPLWTAVVCQCRTRKPPLGWWGHSWTDNRPRMLSAGIKQRETKALNQNHESIHYVCNHVYK